jgi:hypothetical protein
MTTRSSGPGGRTVAEAMLSIPWTHSPAATVGEVAEFFQDEHVHAALIISAGGYLVTVVERGDLGPDAAPDVPAVRLGRLDGRTVQAAASLSQARRAMLAERRRRAAVISPDGRLLGLLCLKASHNGFCSDRDVLERSQEPGRSRVNGA